MTGRGTARAGPAPARQIGGQGVDRDEPGAPAGYLCGQERGAATPEKIEDKPVVKAASAD